MLKRDFWEISQYQKLMKENSEQFDFSGGTVSMWSRDVQGSRKKKKGKKLSSRKSKKKGRHDDEGEGGFRVDEVQAPQVRVQRIK